jgi:hypothetical protein
MAASYARFKAWWGEVELYHTDESVYEAAESKALGTNAQEPNTAVRRCQVVYTRAPTGSTEDVAVTTHDFMNITAGDPDETWTDADFLAVEALLDTFHNAVKPYRSDRTTVSQYRWYRIGPGIVPPNPPVRITAKAIVGTATKHSAPQIAISVTERTAVRRSWGRFYLPSISQNSQDSASGRIVAADQLAISNAAAALYQGSASADFAPVVYSKTRGKVYSVEKVQVDDLFDVIRPRRWDRPLSRLVNNVPA